ncbi:MAG: hypothetical protein H6718_21050 [Polyangiaceae bacterium]|nr:hypothetical protein [Myxococcales bacterium]MCB9587906.1 hypothetical protein [Polyangiaceae bacterium]MCB9608855.1 hypothetical protein [Polyangiaceae bacterium]
MIAPGFTNCGEPAHSAAASATTGGVGGTAGGGVGGTAGGDVGGTANAGVGGTGNPVGGASGAAGGGSAGEASFFYSLPVCIPDGSLEPPHPDLSGSYSVPVSANLEAYAAYPVGDISICRTETTIELGYSLPALLVGKKTRVDFSGGVDPSATQHVLSGKDGTATCNRIGKAWSCLEHFMGIEVDLQRVADEAAALSPAEAQGRIDVATVFQGDPIGVLEFKQP